MAAKKRAVSRDGDGIPGPPRNRPWDPAAVPPAEETDRAFHATHFTADPRGKVKPGAKPKGNSGKGSGR